MFAYDFFSLPFVVIETLQIRNEDLWYSKVLNRFARSSFSFITEDFLLFIRIFESAFSTVGMMEKRAAAVASQPPYTMYIIHSHSDVLMKTFQALCLLNKRGRSSVTDILVAKRIPQDYFLSSKTSLTRKKNLFVLDDISKDQSFLGHTMNIFFF